MKYEPIKKRLGTLVNRFPVLHRLLYWMLDLLFLRAWYVHREVRRLLQTHPPGDSIRVLDAGTGFGQYAYFVARQFPNAQVHAVDLKEEYVNWGRTFTKRTSAGPNITWAVDDLRDLRAEGPFDLILLVDVLEHIADDNAVLRNFERVLAPGQYIVINTPSDQGGSDVQTNQDESFIDEHVRPGYNRDDLEDKLRSVKLTPVRSLYTYGPYGAVAWRWLIKHPMQMIAATRASFLFLPFYFLLAVPLGLLLHATDVACENATGTGLLVVAQKQRTPEREDQRPPLKSHSGGNQEETAIPSPFVSPLVESVRNPPENEPARTAPPVAVPGPFFHTPTTEVPAKTVPRRPVQPRGRD